MGTEELYDMIIVGGGPGGLTAGIYAMRAAMKTALIEKSAYGGQMTLSGEVENYPAFEKISGFDLSAKFQQHAASYGLEMISSEVTGIEPGLDFHAVKLDNGTTLKTHAIILAVGGSPKKLNIPGETEYYGRGVSYCAVCDGFFFRNKTVAVIGGGDSACEESLYLAKLAKQIYIIHRRDELRASRILQERIKGECKIEMIWNSIPTEIHANEQGVSAVRIQDVTTRKERDLAIDGIFIFIGFNPNRSLVPAGIQMDNNGYVLTNDRCETQIPGIFVIGDLRQKYARQIVIAAGDGCTAALVAAHYVENKKATPADSCPAPVV